MQGFNQYFDQKAKLLIKKANNLRDRSKRQYAYQAAILTIYGFQVVIPAIIGLFLGMFLNKHFPIEHVSWTLNLILIGAVIGFYNANMWFGRMIGITRNKSTSRKGDKK